MREDVSTELAATVEARKELGPAHEQELIAGFLDRIDKELDRRIDEKIAKQPRQAARRHRSHEAELGVFVPLFIIAGIFGGVWGIAATAAALVVIFLVSELRR